MRNKLFAVAAIAGAMAAPIAAQAQTTITTGTAGGSTVVIGDVEEDRPLRRAVASGLEESARHAAKRHGQARPRRQPPGYHLASGLPFRQEAYDVALRVGADRVARHDHDLVGERAGDLGDDALQHGEPQREDDGIGALQRVAVVGGDDRVATDLCASFCADSLSALESRRFSPP